MSKLNFILYIALSALLLLLIYFGFIYPSYSDFDFWQISRLSSIERTHSINSTDSNPGYQAFMVVFKLILGVPFELIYQIPIVIIPTFISVLFVLYKLSDNITWASSFSFVFVLSTADVSSWVAGSHQIVLVLFYTLIGLLLIQGIGANRIDRFTLTFLLIVIVMAVNFLSYKITFVVVVMLFSLVALQIISRRFHINATILHGPNIALIISIASVICLNPFFYDVFIPELLSYHDFSTSSGISKLLVFFNSGSSGQSSGLSQVAPTHISTLSLLRTIAMATFLLIYATYVIHGFIVKRKLEIANQVIISILISGVGLFVVYSLFGLAETTVILFATLLLIYFVVNRVSNYHKPLKHMALAILLVANIIAFVASIGGGAPLNNTIDDSYDGMEYASNWSFRNILAAGETSIASDVFTTGFINYQFSTHLEEQTQYVSVLSAKEIRLITSTGAEATFGSEYYVLNAGLEHFSIMGWDKFQSWQQILGEHQLNEELNIIYSSKNVYILNYVG